MPTDDLPRLMAISPPRLDRDEVDWPELASSWEQWVDGLTGKERVLVQVRTRQLPARRLMRVVDLIRSHRPDDPIVVNGRVDIAMVSGADGVQLPERGLPADRVRSLVGQDFYIGRSVHDPEAAFEAARQGVDWVTLSPIYPPLSKQADSPALGLEGLTQAAECGTAIYALGGIQAGNQAHCLRHGAHGVAGITMFDAGAVPTGGSRRGL